MFLEGFDPAAWIASQNDISPAKQNRSMILIAHQITHPPLQTPGLEENCRLVVVKVTIQSRLNEHRKLDVPRSLNLIIYQKRITDQSDIKGQLFFTSGATK